MIRPYRTLPPIVSGYSLESGKSWFSVIVPIARTNLCVNPSFEVNTTSWTAFGSGSIARSAAEQYHGAYSLAVTPTATTTDGAFYAIALTSGTTYAISAKVKGVAGLRYRIAVYTSGNVLLASREFVATGRFQWQWLYYTETSSLTRNIVINKVNHASTAVFYLDGVQIETINAGETVSTFIDGDQLGLVPNQQPPAYYWNGTPHASTSTRSGLTRAGGMVVPLSKYGFLLTAIIGLGLATPQNVATDYARIDGGFDSYTRKPPRQFSLTGRFQANTPAQLDRDRAGLSALLDRDLVGLDQQLTLRYERLGPDGTPTSDAALIHAKYESGLGGNTDNLHAETAAITFTQYLPGIMADADAGSALSVQLTVTDADYILKRSASGVWSALGSGIAGTRVYAILVARSGRVYVGGQYTSAGGVANTNSVAYWDGSTWNAMGTGVTGGSTVYSLAEMPDGSIVAGGDYTQMGGVANTLRLASYNPTTNTWSALSTGANGSVIAMTVGQNGLLYLGGSFTSIGGVAATRLASWNGSAFSALGGGATPNGVNALITGPNGKIYIGGSFTNIGARVAAWNPSTSAYETLGSGVAAGTISALAFGTNGILYAAGDSSAGYVLSYNGVVWSQLSTAFSGTGPVSMQALPDGSLWVGGAFAISSLPALTDSLVKVTPIGSSSSAVLQPVGIDLPGSPGVYAIAQSDGGDLYIGYDTTGSAVTESTTTITNTGTAKTYPTLIIKGPSSGTAGIYQLVNYTTGRSIFFNYTINAGETATLVLTPDNISFVSDIQGNVQRTILPSSNTADFFLQPGANVISFMAGGSSVTATIRWRPNHARLDDLTR